MPSPILKIPVDDSAFQRYLATFSKYQETLKTQPEMWAEIGESVSSAAVAGAAMAEIITEQNKETQALIEVEKKREDALKEADKRRSDEEKARKKEEAAAAKRRAKAIKDIKEYAIAVKDTAISMGKWAVGGGLTGALGLWGLTSLVSGVGDERRSAQGAGVSIGQRQGMNLAMQRYFDVNSTLSNVANMQGDPTQWGTFRMMGIDPRQGDAASLTGQSALAARRMFLADKGNLALAQAQGLTKIFSPEDLRRLSVTPERELRQSIKQGQSFAGISDPIAKKWQDFTITMDTAGLKIKDHFISVLDDLNQKGSLSKLIKGFEDLADAGIDQLGKYLGSQDFQEGLKTFTDYIGSPTFQSDMKEFATNVGLIAQKTVDALRWLGFIPEKDTGGVPGVVDTNKGNLAAAGVGAAVGSLFGPLGAAGGALIGAGVNKAMNYAESGGGMELQHKRVQYIAQNMMKWGWTKAQAAGMIAGLYKESGLDPMKYGDGGNAYGVGQWHPDRQAIYAKLYGHSMQSVTDPARALKEQLEFMNYELSHNEKRAGIRLHHTKDAYQAGYITSMDYERPAGGRAEADRRGRGAVMVYNKLEIKNSTGSSVATVANASAGG